MGKLRRSDILSFIMIAMGSALLLYGLLTPNISDGGARGFGSSDASYPLANLILFGLGAFIVALGASMIFLKGERYVPLPPLYVPMPGIKASDKEAPGLGTEEIIGPNDTDYLVLRLLNGDEREMYRVIVDAGGSVLQKDLIVKLKWSDAKVSRNIDKLIDKGVLSKERYGSTNRVKVNIDKEH